MVAWCDRRGGLHLGIEYSWPSQITRHPSGIFGGNWQGGELGEGIPNFANLPWPSLKHISLQHKKPLCVITTRKTMELDLRTLENGLRRNLSCQRLLIGRQLDGL